MIKHCGADIPDRLAAAVDVSKQVETHLGDAAIEAAELRVKEQCAAAAAAAGASPVTSSGLAGAKHGWPTALRRAMDVRAAFDQQIVGAEQHRNYLTLLAIEAPPSHVAVSAHQHSVQRPCWWCGINRARAGQHLLRCSSAILSESSCGETVSEEPHEGANRCVQNIAGRNEGKMCGNGSKSPKKCAPAARSHRLRQAHTACGGLTPVSYTHLTLPTKA